MLSKIDIEFAKDTIAEHKDSIDDANEFIQKGDDPSLKEMAREHIDHANKVIKMMSNLLESKGGISGKALSQINAPPGM